MPNAPVARNTSSPIAEARDARQRNPGRDITDDRDALGLQVERRREGDPDDERDQRARDPRHQPPEDQDADDSADPERGRVRVGQAESCAIPTRRWRIVPSTAGIPSRAGSWPMVIVDRQPDHEAGHDRDGEELRQESEPRCTGDHEDRADRQRERRAQRDVPAGSAAAIAPTTDADMIAIDELVVTFRWRDVPKTAYAVSAANAVTSPVSGGIPARPA